jgi:hypothetical protein
MISKYNGKLLIRVRPQNDAYIQSNIEKPYEIRLVEFENEQDFNNFMEDYERKGSLHLKEQSIRSVVLMKGSKL